jgi:hypothetical protein
VLDGCSDSVAGTGDLSAEMSDDTEELVPKAVPDLTTGKVQGNKGTHTLYLVDGSINQTRLTGRGSRTTTSAHAKLANAFTAAW